MEALGVNGLFPSLPCELPSSSAPKASCSSLGLQLSQNGKSLLKNAKPRMCQAGGRLCSITSPLQAPAYLGRASL